MKRKFLVVGLSAAFAFVGSVGGWYLYQHHLSSDLKRTLVASSDEHATEADIHVYLRDGRLQIKTAKDREVFEKFEKAVNLLSRADDIHHRLFQESMNQLRSQADNPCTWPSAGLRKQDVEFNRKVCADHIASYQSQKKLADEEEKEATSDKAKGIELYQQVRAEIGLKPVLSK